jgi:hypothetical protein
MATPRLNASHDDNFVPTLLGVSSFDGKTPVPLEVDPATGALLITGVTSSAAKPATSTPTSTSASTTSALLFASNLARLGATVYNEGAATIYLAFAATATLSNYTIQIVSGGYYEVPFGYTGAAACITSAGTSTVRVTELS